MASGRPTLSTQEVLDKLYKEWSCRENPNCTVSSLDEFLTKFHADLKAEFEITASISEGFLRAKFVISTGGQQAFPSREIQISGRRLFYEYSNDSKSIPLRNDGNIFGEVCEAFRKYLQEATKPGQSYSYAELEKYFDSAKRQLRRKQGLSSVGIPDVIARLFKNNFLLINYTRATPANQMKMPNNEEKNETRGDPDDGDLEFVYGTFTKYLDDLKDRKPYDRDELESLYLNEFKLHLTSYHQIKEGEEANYLRAPFRKVVDKLKARRYLKFVGGEAVIDYLFDDSNQSFGRRGEVVVGKRKGKAGKVTVNLDVLSSRIARERLAEDHNGITIRSLETEEELADKIKEIDMSEEERKEKEQHLKEGIINFGSVLKSEDEGIRHFRQIEIKFEAATGSHMKLTQLELLDNLNNVFTIGDKENIQQGNRELTMPHESSYKINLYYRSKEVGFQTCPLALFFKPNDGTKKFEIFRFLQAETRTPEMEAIAPIGPYEKSVSDDEYVGHVEKFFGAPRPKISAAAAVAVKVPLKNYPNPIKNFCPEHVPLEACMPLDTKKDFLENYQGVFHWLLFIEESQWQEDMKRYNQTVELHRTAACFRIEVPGLAESRPSILIGDRVFVREKYDKSTEDIPREYEGFVHEIEGEKILVRFPSRFYKDFTRGQKYIVRFTFNRRTLRMMHRAIDMMIDLHKKGKFPSLMPPSKTNFPPLATEMDINSIRVFDRKIEKNEEQLTAVKNIVAGSSRPYPYIIYGPPGTGKTVTCVEAMRQVLKLLPNSRILACAPSNYAVDLMLHRLLNPCPIPKKQLFRLNAKSRSLHTLPEKYDMKPYCKIDGEGSFDIPSWEEIKAYKVVFCTMTTAGRLVSMGAPIDHFTHVFMDECGQAMEPETLVPLAGLLDPGNVNGGQVVLAGDPKQLGPVIRAKINQKSRNKKIKLEKEELRRKQEGGKLFPQKKKGMQKKKGKQSKEKSDEREITRGLETSLLESLMETNKIYKPTPPKGANQEGDAGKVKNQYNQKYITKLLKNYRSHPEILTVPNALFYDNELVACADKFMTTTLCHWKSLPTKDFPIIFHGVEGKDLRESRSPSFFNQHEAKEVVNYVKLLLDEKSLGVSPDQIGIISPYRKQVSKIRKLLETECQLPNVNEIKVGPVEEFQGDERRIIIVSTSRCNMDYLKIDVEFHLGFLNNQKRFNVAITRAQALLIVIGNPFVLSIDAHWKVFLDFCVQNGAYKGCEYPDDWEAEIEKKLKNLGIGGIFHRIPKPKH